MIRGHLERATIMRVLQNNLPELKERYDVLSLGLFGSYARGRPRRTSDVDLLVEFDRTPSLFTFIELELHLSHLLGAKVDLVMRKALKPEIGSRILSEVLPI